MKVYNVKKLKNIWYEESCDFCPNTIFENEIYYLLETNNENKSNMRSCKQCIKELIILEEK